MPQARSCWVLEEDLVNFGLARESLRELQEGKKAGSCSSTGHSAIAASGPSQICLTSLVWPSCVRNWISGCFKLDMNSGRKGVLREPSFPHETLQIGGHTIGPCKVLSSRI